jgi:dihydrodipicolinate synthase/N-acetylneuraminate lyase
MPDSIKNSRAALVRTFFPSGLPTLWCPPLTHYTDAAALDKKRIRAHLAHMAPHVKTHLIPGSTGDGWELSEAEIHDLLEFTLREAKDLDIQVLIGVLRPDGDKARRDVEASMEWLKNLTGSGDPEKALLAAGVCGFTVCAPKGKALSQEFISGKLTAVLDLGYPTALYQLPQITENEIAPKTFEALAARYANFYLFKDTSGRDAVALSGGDTHGVFMVRGMEGDSARWYKPTPGGLYDGFLLSTANCFAREYRRLMGLVEAGKTEDAAVLSYRVSRAVMGALERAGKIPFGNAFANSNKAFDHFFAHGPGARKIASPMTHSGSRLPDEFVQYAGDLLEDEELMPEKGYL